jgi:hypothetical protein
MEFKPGEKILVRNGDRDTWRQRWFVAFHPFNNKVITTDITNVQASWFRYKKLNSNSNDS